MSHALNSVRRKPLLIVVSIAAMWIVALAMVTGSPALAAGTSSSIGKTAVGNSSGGFVADRKRVSRYSVGAAGSVSKLSIYLGPTSTSGQQTLKGLIYSDAGGAPQSLLASSNELVFHSTDAAGWYDLTFASPANLAAGNYWFGVMTGGGAGVAGFRYDDVTGSRIANANIYTSGAGSTFGTPTTDTVSTSLYATLTPTPPTTTTTTTTASTTPTTTTTTTATTTTTSASTTTSSPSTDQLWAGNPSGSGIDSSQWASVSAVSGHVAVVTDPLGSGKKVYQYAVPDSDQPYSGSQPRADMLSKFLLQDGGTYYFSTSVYIPAGQIPPVTGNNWVQISQAKNTASSLWTNAMHLMPRSGSSQNYFGFTSNGLNNHGPDWYSPVPVDARWHNLTVKTRMSTSANGTIDIWWDGVKQTFLNGAGTLTNVVTMNTPTSDYLGTGWPLDLDFYRSRGFITDHTPVIYHNVAKIGKTYASVAPAVFNSP